MKLDFVKTLSKIMKTALLKGFGLHQEKTAEILMPVISNRKHLTESSLGTAQVTSECILYLSFCITITHYLIIRFFQNL